MFEPALAIVLAAVFALSPALPAFAHEGHSEDETEIEHILLTHGIKPVGGDEDEDVLEDSDDLK